MSDGLDFKVSRDALAEAVQWTARALPARPPVPILAGVKIKVAQGVLELSTFDREVSARSEVPVESAVDGEALVSGKLLAEISRVLPNRDVSVRMGSGTVDISCGNTNFSLSTMSLDDYPAFPQLPELQGTVDSTEFARAISQVVIASSKEEAVPLLTGVKVIVDGNKMTLLSTDRYRLALRELEWSPARVDFQTSLLVKAKVLADVAKSMAGAGEVEIHLSDSEQDRSSLIGFSAGGRRATSVLMDGDYPAVMRLFPEETPLTYSCNRQELLEAVKRVSLVAERKTAVRLTFADGALELEAGQGDAASARESIQMFTDCEDIRTAFNPQYLQEGLSVCDTEMVRFGFTDPKKASVLEGQVSREEGPDKSFRYLLMPIQYGA